MMHKISQHLTDYDCWFTPFYCDGFYQFLQKKGLLDFTIIGGQNRKKTEAYLQQHQLPVDYAGKRHQYDLFLTCTDLLVQENIRNKPVVLVQEGMTDPENLAFHFVKHTRKWGIPLWLASTSTTGLSDSYQAFCVASEGYRDHFLAKGVKGSKLKVTGIPNFDDVDRFLNNSFQKKGYVLVCTTDTRENFKVDFRKRFLKQIKKLSGEREVIFKLHPNENRLRSEKEIQRFFPNSLICQEEDPGPLIANADVVITQYSTLVYVAMALGKEAHSYFDKESLKKLVPIQNGGQSARNISQVCREFL